MSSFIEKHPEFLDLGEEEIKVYNLLYKVGECSAKVICAQIDVPYSRIHAVLYRLQEAGLVISRGETLKLFSLRFRDPQLPQLWKERQRPEETAP